MFGPLPSLRCFIALAATTGSLACLQVETDPVLPPVPRRPPEEPKPYEVGSCTDHPDLGWCQSEVGQLSEREGRAELLRGAALDVLGQHCAECHSAAGAQAAVGPLAIDDAAELVRSGLVIPLNSAQSPLLQLLGSGTMPPPDRAPLRAHELELLALWIDTPSFWPGAAPECEPAASTADLEPLLQQVAADLAGWPASDQPYQRYLSLAHRASAECNSAELELERQALSKGLNMVSRDRRVHAPAALDAARTLYRIDLRDYDWRYELTIAGRTFADAWEAIAAASPYSVELTGPAAAAARSTSGTAFPLLLADHVLDAALTGELYYALLGIASPGAPSGEVLNALGIDEADNLENEELQRAVTTRSRFSGGHRIVQRQELGIRRGVLWQALEYPAPASRDPDDLAFWPVDAVEGATQMMFTLPNGLFGFLISDGSSALTMPDQVVVDVLGYPLPASAAVTCSACHVAGVLPVVDEMREPALKLAREVADVLEIDEIEAIYPLPAELERTAQRDSDEFHGAALRQLDLRTSGRDPLAAASLRFGAPLTLRDAAAELGVSEALLRSRLPELPWLAPLTQGTLRRDDFAPLYVKSRCVLAEGSAQSPEPALCERALAAP